MRNLGKYRKAIVAALGAAAVIAAELPADAPSWLTGTFAVLSALAVLAVRNDRPVTREDLKRQVDYPTRAATPEERPRRRPPPTGFP
jgi:membrane protein implicated in regulation of membrane protease activity